MHSTQPRQYAQRLRMVTILAIGLAVVPGATSPRAASASPTLLIMGGGGTQAFSGLYSLDVATGASTFLAPVLVPGDDPNLVNGGLVYDPLLRKLYATGASFSAVSTLYEIDPVTGVGSAIGPSGGSVWLSSGGLAFDPVARRLYATGQDNTTGQHTGLYELNLTTGAATLIAATLQPGAYLHGLGFDETNGTLYANGFAGFAATLSALFTLETASGTETPIGPHGVAVGRQLFYSGIAFHPVTHVCYSFGSVSASQSGLYTLDTSTGAASLIGPFASTIATDGGLAFVPDLASSAVTTAAAAPSLVAGPNPFTTATTFSYALRAPGRALLQVYDLAGRRVATISDGPQDAGSHQVSWKPRHGGSATVPAGVYFVRLDVDGRTETLKVVRTDF